MTTYTSLDMLEQNLSHIIRQRSGKHHVAIIAGHYPLNREFKAAILPKDTWSYWYFSMYSMELGCRLCKIAKDKKMDAKIAILVDDHYQMEIHDRYIQELRKFPKAQHIRKKLHAYFQKFKLPAPLKKIMTKYGLSEKDLCYSTMNKSMFFQESRFREIFEERYPTEDAWCSGEVRILYEDLSMGWYNKVIAFYPRRCKTPTCHAITKYNEDAKKNASELIDQERMHIYLSSSRYDERNNLITTKEQLEKQTIQEYQWIYVHKE